MTQPSRDGRISRSLSIVLFIIVAATAGAVAVLSGGPGRDKGVKGPPEDSPVLMAIHRASRKYLEADDTKTLKHRFPCPDPSECGGQDYVELIIRPEDTSNERAWNTLFDEEGHILAAVQNKQSVPYGPWGLKAKDDVYLWVGQLANNAGVPALYRIRGLGRPVLVHTFDAWRPCAGDARPAEVHLEPYGVCPRDGRPGDGLWMSCSGGCCQVRAPTRLVSEIQPEVTRP